MSFPQDRAPTGANGRVVVVGSVNVDYVVEVDRRPEPGETVGGATLHVHPGGKGANQAVAAARCGARVELVACVGNDVPGRERCTRLRAEGVGVEGVRLDEDAPTGIALITTTPDGENTIIVAPGANYAFRVGDVELSAGLLAVADVVLVQLEVPLAVVERALDLAGARALVVLNAAPAMALPRRVLRRVDLLIVNEHEAAALAGVRPDGLAGCAESVDRLRELGPRSVVVTLGAAGAFAANGGGAFAVAAPSVAAIDTTGAGDAFAGAVAARLAAKTTLAEAVRFGVAVGSATTEHRGAGVVLPSARRAETERQTGSGRG